MEKNYLMHARQFSCSNWSRITWLVHGWMKLKLAMKKLKKKKKSKT